MALAPPSSPAFETPELSDLDHAVYEYLCLRGFNSIAQAFMTSTFQCGGSVPVPMSSLYRFWHAPVPDQQQATPTTATTPPLAQAPGPGTTPAVVTAATTTQPRPSPTGDKLHPCTWPNCTQSFRKKSNLQRHMLLHEGRRPYRCTVTVADGTCCDKTFARESDLAAHVRVHNGVRPFVCPDCGRKFTRNSDWRSHVKSVHNRAPYSCPGTGCGGRFETLKELRAHFPHCTASDANAEKQRIMAAAVDDDLQDGDGGGGDAVPVVAVTAPCQVSTCSHNPPLSTSPKRFACSGHGQPSFQVRHDDHIDFLIDGELHHWTDKYCESHGLFSLIDYAPSSTPLSN